MGEELEWRWLASIGVICIIQTFFDFMPEGPWNSRSFSRGVIGLIGLCCLYVSWFRSTFNKKGLIPTIEIWKNPEQSWRYVLFFGVLCYVFVILLNLTNINNNFPKTTGMIVLLIGSLSILNSVYVWLVVKGPLVQKIELEQE